MLLRSFTYDVVQGWSVESFPALDSEQTLVIVFAAPEYFDDPAPITELYRAYPTSRMIGCSTAGEIANSDVNDNSMSVVVLKLEHTRLALASTPVEGIADSLGAGKRLASQLPFAGLRGVFVLSDGLATNGSQLVQGLSDFPSNVPVVGGLAADGSRFQRTWVIHEGVPRIGTATAVGFYGERFHMTHGARGGWDTFGPERRVTRAKDNVLYELDGKPALALYKDYLGERAADLPASGLLFPLSIRSTPDDNKCLIRTILGVDEQQQSLIFAGDVPENFLVRLMRASFNKLVDGAASAATLATQAIPTPRPMLAIAVSCVGRRLVLGEHVEDETEALLAQLPDGAVQVGYYSYGGISPYSTGSCDFHNQTMMLTTFHEE